MKLILPTKDLLEATEYRGFLSILYAHNKKQSPQFSYAYIAQRCHFSSKSFVKEVIDGKKSLSIKSTHKIIEGLALPSLWGKYFYNLVMSDDPLPGVTPMAAQKELRRLRRKLIDKKTLTVNESESQLFQLTAWPHVYAALGSEEKGASMQDILNRTLSLGSNLVESTLAHLVTVGMVVKKGKRFYAAQDTAFFENLGKVQFFKNFYLQAVQQLFDKSRKDFNSPDSLFYTMSLSLNPAKMPEFRRDLAELLDKYTAEIEQPEGTRVASLTCGFHLL